MHSVIYLKTIALHNRLYSWRNLQKTFVFDKADRLQSQRPPTAQHKWLYKRIFRRKTNKNKLEFSIYSFCSHHPNTYYYYNLPKLFISIKSHMLCWPKNQPFSRRCATPNRHIDYECVQGPLLVAHTHRQPQVHVQQQRIDVSSIETVLIQIVDILKIHLLHKIPHNKICAHVPAEPGTGRSDDARAAAATTWRFPRRTRGRIPPHQ